MEIKTYSTSTVLILALSLASYSQTASSESHPINNENTPCISEKEYEIIEQRCNENLRSLNLVVEQDKNLRSVTLLDWPLKAAAGLTDCSYYYISAYVDHNAAGGAFQDFNCGSNTYDSHRGTDISTWPYNFYKMDNNLVEVIAAAPGTILDKHDGEFDRNCSSNNLTANYVVIQHADGSQAMYWHMKNGSITSKAIGQTVVAGELLGIVGSSGNASGPHLHFEVRTSSNIVDVIDPFAGTCNLMNASSWWNTQKTYTETGVIKVSVNTTDIPTPVCPTTEVSNESDTFQIPFQGVGMTAGYAKFYMFIRNPVSGLVADLKILNPDASTNLSWTYTTPNTTKTLTWGFSKKLPLVDGHYTFTATYNGTTCSTPFDITSQGGVIAVEEEFSPTLKIYPNPSTGKFTIENGDGSEIVIYDLLGIKVYQSILSNQKTEVKLNSESGVYFYLVKNKDVIISSGKLVLE